MTQAALANAQLSVPLRLLALTVEAAGTREFRWRILESFDDSKTFTSLACAEMRFSAYDAALATGYGELQRLIGGDLQYGPRVETTRQPHGKNTPSTERLSA